MSDHHITNTQAFAEAAQKAATLARDGWLVAFGIEAKLPETGFGYIKRGEALDETGFRVDRLVEKPDLATALAFLADGGYSWNGGLFAFTAGRFLEELAAHRPELADAVAKAAEGGHEEGAVFRPDAEAFGQIADESVDYAVMEETTRGAVVPADMGWSDIGNWAALRDANCPDPAGNVAPETAELVDCRNVMANSDGPWVSGIGPEDVTVVVSGNEVLLTSGDGAQKVGTLTGAANQ